VIGASGGIGGALCRLLASNPAINRVWALSRSQPDDLPASTTWRHVDVNEEATLQAAAGAIRNEGGSLRLVIVASGILRNPSGKGPEKTWQSLEAETMLEVLSVNTVGPALVAKHFLPVLVRDRKSVFAALSARVGSISDNRAGGWYSYRVSKAALNMVIKTLSIELARRNPRAICVGLHPGTVETRLSQPFVGAQSQYNPFTAQEAAHALLGVIDDLTISDSGRCLAWDGSLIAP